MLRIKDVLAWIGAAAIGGAAVAGLMGAAQQRAQRSSGTVAKTIEANEVLIKDRTGNVRARLGWGAQDDDATLSLADAEGTPRILFHVDKDGKAGATIGTELNAANINFMAGAEGPARMRVGNGKTGVAFEVKPDGQASMWLTDTKGKDRGGLGVSAEGEASIELADADGKVTFHAPR
jgi:hypothetical protein